MNVVDISQFVSDIPELVIAAMPIAAYFISNWFTVATAAYYRVTPTYCTAAMLHMIAQTAVGFIAILITVGIAIRANGLLAMLPPVAYLFLMVGLVLFVIILLCSVMGSRILLLSTSVLVLGGLEFTVEEVLLQLTLLCALFFLFGLVDTVLRRDYLVDVERAWWF